MLEAILALFVIALIAAFFGFGGIAGLALGGAKLLLFAFLAIVVVALVVSVLTGRRV